LATSLYRVAQEHDLQLTFEAFKQKYGADGAVNKDSLTLLQQHKDDPSQKVRRCC